MHAQLNAGPPTPPPAIPRGNLSKLQEPVRDRAGLLVRVLNVRLDDGQVAADHVQGGVSKQALKGHDVTVVSEKGNGECVPEPVQRDPAHSRALPNPLEGGAQVVALQLALGLGREEKGTVALGVAGGQVAPDRLRGASR